MDLLNNLEIRRQRDRPRINVERSPRIKRGTRDVITYICMARHVGVAVRRWKGDGDAEGTVSMR